MKARRTAVLVNLLLIPVLLLSLVVQPATSAKAATNLGLTVDAAILIDADSGKILYEQNARESLGVASMSKMITEYILLDAIEAGDITWDQKYQVTDYTYAISQNRALSNVPLREDGSYTIRELYEAMAIYSANAATVAIAETIAGSEKAFLELMEKKVEDLGITDYKFVNSTGLNNKDLQGYHPEGTGETDENMMSAASIALIAYHLLKDHPDVLETAKIKEKTFREGTSDAIVMKNWNFMLPGLIYEYEGVDGLKTGTTDFAGHAFTGTAIRDGQRLIAVVMKAVDANGEGSYKARFDATKKLFDYGFSQFKEQEVLPKGTTIKGSETIEVTKGKEDTVGIATADAISFMTTKDEIAKYTPTLFLDKETLEADVKEGTVVGKVVLEHAEGQEYGYIDGGDLTVDVVTTSSVERSGWFSLFFAGVGSFFGNIWDGIKEFVGGIF